MASGNVFRAMYLSFLGLNLGVGALNGLGSILCGICCHGNDHVAIATKTIPDVSHTPYWNSNTKSSCDSIATPLTKAPREGQGAS